MTTLLFICGAILIGGGGCWLSTAVLPAGPPRLIAQVASVLAGFGTFFSGLRLL